MTQSRMRRGQLPAVALLIALLASLLPATSVSAAAVFPATGGTAISVDTFGTGTYVTVSGPGISEVAAGELALGTTTILNAPAGFRFNPGVGNTTIGGGTCTGTPLAGTLSVTASTATFTVTQASAAARAS
ncbi:MAG: hypothetical protein FJ038_13840 [Chloroflexi bacterium]|nr:hypothetical protein [Chloroflexota bacterium]